MGAFFAELVHLTLETAPWLLIGFLAAGVIKVALPVGRIYAHLGGDDLPSVFRASLYGIPLPLCSCSVLPTAQALKDGGAGKGATAAFLVSTPETGVDSISVTWALIDPIMTVVRPVVAFVTALVTGSAVNLLVRRGWDSAATADADPGDTAEDCGDALCADECAEPDAAPVSRTRAALHYAFVTLLDDLTPWLAAGLAVSALISVLTPDSFFVDAVPGGLLSMLLMAVVAAPLYICATASTPIAATLIAKGLEPGAALVFLLVGPATNVATLLIVGRMLGRRTLAVYLAGIAGTALVAGALVNWWYAASGIDIATRVDEALHDGEGPLVTAAGLVLVGLMAASGLRLARRRPPPTPSEQP